MWPSPSSELIIVIIMEGCGLLHRLSSAFQAAFAVLASLQRQWGGWRGAWGATGRPAGGVTKPSG